MANYIPALEASTQEWHTRVCSHSIGKSKSCVHTYLQRDRGAQSQHVPRMTTQISIRAFYLLPSSTDLWTYLSLCLEHLFIIFWSNSCLSFSSKFKLWKTFPDWVKYYAPPTHPIESRCLLPISQRHSMPHGQGNVPTTTSIILSTGIQVLRMQTQFPQLPEKNEGVQVFLVPLGICSRTPAGIKSTVAQVPYVQWHSISI